MKAAVKEIVETAPAVSLAPPLAPALAAIDWADLATRDPPPRQWAVQGWLGFGHVTLLVGPGGIGKTLLAQQLASALAVGRPFVDDVARPLKSLMWGCEDDEGEFWRRQIPIARWLNAGLEVFSERLHIVPRHGLDNTIVSTEYGRLMFTPRLQELREQANDLDAQVVILDNSAQLFGINENDRHSVTAALNALAGALPGRAVLLLSHPARAAGSEFSGSSAWENTARTRLYLGANLPGEQRDEDDPDQNVRYLSRRKANYSAKDWRRFTYREGVLVPDAIEAEGGMVGHLREQAAERTVLAGLRRLQELGIRVTEGGSSPAFLPRVLIEHKLADGRNKAELADAMRRLRLDGKIVPGIVGTYANRTKMQGLVIAQ